MGPKGPPRGPPRGPPKPTKPAVPQPKYDPNVGVGRNFRHTTKHGTADRWEVVDRRPILIGGGVVFLLLILGVAFYIGKLKKGTKLNSSKWPLKRKSSPNSRFPRHRGLLKCQSKKLKIWRKWRAWRAALPIQLWTRKNRSYKFDANWIRLACNENQNRPRRLYF